MFKISFIWNGSSNPTTNNEDMANASETTSQLNQTTTEQEDTSINMQTESLTDENQTKVDEEMEQTEDAQLDLTQNNANEFENNLTTITLNSSSSTLWDKTYSNVSQVKKKLSVSWPFGDTSEKYINVYITNTGKTTIKANILNNDPLLGSDTIDKATIAPGKSKLFTILSDNFYYTGGSTQLETAQIFVYCTNLDLENISMSGRAAFYSN